MHISQDEAFQLLEKWRTQSTPLGMYISGRQAPVTSTVESLTGTVVRLISESESFEFDLDGAEFNGDDGSRSANQLAYLNCEFRDGTHCSLYAQARPN